MRTRVVAVIAAVLLLGATPTPSPAPSQPIVAPSIPPGIGNVVQGIINTITGNTIAPLNVDPNHVRGQVTYFRHFDLQIAMPLQTYKQIHLHQGTIINPRGASINDGQTVDVVGKPNADGSMEANEITIIHG
jgi:hypothetical protein